ncbi:two-component sensor histidine kinase [Roseomonas fluvialis]|uniref:histidine kinase n=1 Tax=Roseomonas fluvialis TaxID=1750527 RepID=A0ABN6P8N5_9PROT|nr:two-component sensor histidine kinase [Roseomonas fluvialis]
MVSSAVLLMGMLVQGHWISSTIEDKAKYHAGAAATLFVDHILGPHFANSEVGDVISPAQHEAIDALMRRASERMQVAALKIWSPEGTVVYSTNPQILGQRFEPTEALRRALDGMTSVEFDILDDAESTWERNMNVPLIEVYVPIRNAAGRVVAVAEFYENAEVLNNELVRSRRDTWVVTGAVFIAMIVSLLGIVTRGSQLIEQQRHSLTEKVRELSDLLSQNSLLRGRVEQASRLAAAENEQFLHRLGAELHDGPAQLISFALLRLGTVAPAGDDEPPFGPIRTALSDAMNEVRSISAGLCMPGVTQLPFADAIASVIEGHERRTGTVVASHFAGLPSDTPHFVKTSICRFVQEGLNNSFRHAQGKGQSVDAWCRDGTIVVEISDTGPGMTLPIFGGPHGGLGLSGLANRMESLGGTLRIDTVPGNGTRLTATMPFVTPEGRTGS